MCGFVGLGLKGFSLSYRVLEGGRFKGARYLGNLREGSSGP